MTVAAVLLAGVVGALLRFGASKLFASRSGFPRAVLIVNVVGSAIAGIFVALSVHAGLSSDDRLIFVTGFCGGLTTFSTFSVESIQLVVAGRFRTAALSVAANLVLGIGAAAAAYALTSALVR